MNYKKLEQVKAIKMLGVWLTEDVSWQMNTEMACKKAYSRVALLTKLKYVGVNRNDLLDIYKLFIRSCLEYCSVLFHTMLTQKQEKMYENCQKVCLKVILASEYQSYESALQICSLSTLFQRRESRMLKFSMRSLKHPKHKEMFPPSRDISHDVRNPEKFHVNFAYGQKYKMSFIPQAQRRLNAFMTE